MAHLADLMQQPVQRRFTGDVAPLIGQARHDLAGRQILNASPLSTAMAAWLLDIA